MHKVTTYLNTAATRVLEKLSKRKWPAVPEPQGDLEAIRNTVSALKARSLVQSRETGNIRDSFVTVEDLIKLGVIDESGKLLSTRVKSLEDKLNP